MKDTDIEGIESFLGEINEDIERDSTDKASDRMSWLLSMAVVTDNRDLFVIEGILRSNIRRFKWIVKSLESMKEKGIMEEKEAEDILRRALSTLTDMTILSKDYLRDGDKTKFFESITQNYSTLQEIKETLRLEVKE
jgi:hypothetical protein